jgi:hypothetical protein
MDYPETLATLGTKETGRRQTKQKTNKKLIRSSTRTPPKNEFVGNLSQIL